MRMCLEGVYGEIDTLPGCTQVAISHGVFVPLGKRGKGSGKAAQAARLSVLKDGLGYDYAICTVDLKNAAQKHILEEAGWRYLSSFTSSKTGHQVAVFGRNL